MNPDRSLLRAPNVHGHHRVTFLELFFDLVFVFAVTQLSHALIAHLTPMGAVEGLVLLLALWWTWICTSWVTNWLDPEKLPVRLLLLSLMLVGLIFSSSLPQAFGSRGLAFAGAFFVMEVGRSIFFVWATKEHPTHRRNFQRILTWFALGGLFWLAGAFFDHGVRLALWALGILIAYVGAWVGYWTPGLGCSKTQDWKVEGGHMAERCGLFMIIALGESILVTGSTFSSLEWTPTVVGAFVTSLIGSFAMWWLYFATNAEAASHRFMHAADPGKLARLAYTYMHLPLVMGVILSAAADELVLAHPMGHTDIKTALVVLGFAAVYLLGNAGFKWAVWDRLPLVSCTVAVALLALVPLAGLVPPLLLLSIANLAIVGAAIWESRACRPSQAIDSSGP